MHFKEKLPIDPHAVLRYKQRVGPCKNAKKRMRQEIGDGKEIPENIGEELAGETRTELRKSYVIFKDRLYIIVYFPRKKQRLNHWKPELETLLILTEEQKRWLEKKMSQSEPRFF